MILPELARFTEENRHARVTGPHAVAPFATLEDPRIQRTKRYNLLDILFIALCAVVSGANDCVAMEKFGKSKRDWLEKYLSLPHGTPCHDTFTRVFAALDGEAFVACFLKWVEALQESTDGQLVAIDGKTARATLDRAKGKNPLHIVSAGPPRTGCSWAKKLSMRNPTRLPRFPSCWRCWN